MKKRPKRRRTLTEPQVILVGNYGEITRDSRLSRLRMTKKYKNFLKKQEYEESKKVNLPIFNIFPKILCTHFFFEKLIFRLSL